MQAVTVSDSLAPMSRHLQTAARTLAQRERLALVLAAFAATAGSALLAPGSGVSFWDWTRILLIVVAGTVAAASLAAAKESSGSGAHLGLALAATSLALALAATFGVATATLCSLALTTVDAAIMSERLRYARELAVAALAVLTPWWVWTALGAWDDRLILLVPLAALGLNALAHVRLAGGVPKTSPSDPLNARGHRLAAWLSLIAGATILLLVGVGTGAAAGWLTLGGLVCAGAIAVAYAVERLRGQAAYRLYPILPILAFVVLGATWLASL
jgi:hypothetical protein